MFFNVECERVENLPELLFYCMRCNFECVYNIFIPQHERIVYEIDQQFQLKLRRMKSIYFIYST